MAQPVTLRASLSGTFLQTLPQLFMPLNGVLFISVHLVVVVVVVVAAAAAAVTAAAVVVVVVVVVVIAFIWRYSLLSSRLAALMSDLILNE